MSPPTTVAVLVERIENLVKSLDDKHGQNRKDIHQMKNDIQQLTNQIWLIKIKLAAYAASGAGAGVGIIELVKYLHNILK
jgi:hypothetical protein